jgi:lysine-specific demethylase 8
VARFRREYLRSRRPVVLTGAIDHWPARAWTAEGLAERLGDCAVNLALLDAGHVRADLERGIRFAPSRLGAFLADLERGAPPRYYLRLRLAGPHRALRDELDVPPYCLGRLALDVSLLMGGRGTIVDLHYDMLHNLVAQLRGTRRITLFSPAEAGRMYPYPLRTLHWHHSRVAFEAPDPAAFPRFREARPLQVDLGPGEMLFIPRGWWHHFESLDASLAVNFFWLTPRLVPAMAVAQAAWLLKRVSTY